MLQKVPWTFIITKVNNTSPKGVITFTVKQDKFEPEHDYVCLDKNSEYYGDMYADYYSSNVLPINNDKGSLVIEAPNYNVRLGTSKVLSVKIYDSENNDITNTYSGSQCIWDIEMEHVTDVQEELIIIDESYSAKDGNEFKCKFKFNGDEQYLENNIKVSCIIDNMAANVLLNIVAL